MMALQKSILSAVLGAIALLIGLILFQSSAKEVSSARQIGAEPAVMSYDELSKTKRFANRHVFVQDSLRGAKFATAGDSFYAPVFPGFEEGNGDNVRLVAKLDGFANSDEAAKAFAANDIHGVLSDVRIPAEAQATLRGDYPFITFSRCKVVDFTHPIPEQRVSRTRIAAFSLIGLALITFIYAVYAAWKSWQFAENGYTLLDKSTMPENTRKFFAAQSERLERLGFKRVCDVTVRTKNRATVRTFVSSDLKTVAVIESTKSCDSYRMGSIATDGTYLRTCSKDELLNVKVAPVVEFQAPSDDAAIGYAAHHKGCLALESEFSVERLVIDPRNVLGFLDYDNRVTCWAQFEQGTGGRPEPLPSADEIQKERSSLHIFHWAPVDRTEEQLAAAGV